MRVVASLRAVGVIAFAGAWLGGAALSASEKEAPARADASKSWAFRSPTRPALPAVRNTGWVHNPIDAFILAKQEEAGLQPAVPADRAVLLRRLTFDLHGLPPTPEEVEAFVNDPAPDAYERQVDRLLASPRFGERWATFWLDLVRFAESDGFKADDPRPHAWRYRDYVIGAFNQDKPYDRFVREQLAGDELYPGDTDAQIATGYNRHFPDEYNAVNLEQRRQEILNDMTDTTAQVFLGLTVGCARCHDHKFDPILQEDYYRLQAFFAGYQPVDAAIGRAEAIEQHEQQMRQWEAQTAELRRKLADLEEPYRKKFLAQRRFRFPKEYQELLDIPEEKRTPVQRQLVTMVLRQVQASSDEVGKSMKGEVKQQWQDLNKQMAEFARLKPPAPASAMALTDVGPVAPATFLLRRGEWRHPEKEITPGFLSAIEDRLAPVPPPSTGARTTGRRGVLAEWLTRPDHPLTARVLVNRLWHHHFGRGLVATPSDFGSQGDPPTHPELLDWLARAFVDRGWSLKAMHRLMVTSATYRQSSHWDEAGAKADPENRLLWRMNRRRLEGEALRDALLSVSGQLNLTAGGPSVYPELPTEIRNPTGWKVSPDAADRNRRSVYIFVKRNLRYPLFSAFDTPDSNETCARRFMTTTAPQALMLLNGNLTLEQARAFAGRVLREVGPEPAPLLERLFRLALGRSPDAEEQKAMLAFLERETAHLRQRLDGKNQPPAPVEQPAGTDPAFAAAVVDLCHALVNVNEFLYVD
jgi:hypothetical protein